MQTALDFPAFLQFAGEGAALDFARFKRKQIKFRRLSKIARSGMPLANHRRNQQAHSGSIASVCVERAWGPRFEKNSFTMSSQPVFADAFSRLHADIAIVRLIRAGIGANKISAVFPRRSAPNSVCCWLKHFNRIPIASTLPLAAAGLLGRLFKRDTTARALEQELEALGLSPENSHRILERIENGSMVLCVHARSAREAAVARRIFQQVGAENITGAGVNPGGELHDRLGLAPELAGIPA